MTCASSSRPANHVTSSLCSSSKVLPNDSGFAFSASKRIALNDAASSDLRRRIVASALMHQPFNLAHLYHSVQRLAVASSLPREERRLLVPKSRLGASINPRFYHATSRLRSSLGRNDEARAPCLGNRGRSGPSTSLR